MMGEWGKRRGRTRRREETRMQMKKEMDYDTGICMKMNCGEYGTVGVARGKSRSSENGE